MHLGAVLQMVVAMALDTHGVRDHGAGHHAVQLLETTLCNILTPRRKTPCCNVIFAACV